VPHFIWDPCCGTGTITTELRVAGHEVVATDIANYGIPITSPGYYDVDFLLEQQAPKHCQGIVCNPPYKLAPQFVRHALTLVPFVAMLLRLAFLESASRTDILEDGQLARVLVFRKRLPMMHRHGWDGPKASNSIAFAWFVWRRDWRGNPQIKRIDRA
jgi:tRNA G10  N-methylase Trm11